MARETTKVRNPSMHELVYGQLDDEGPEVLGYDGFEDDELPANDNAEDEVPDVSTVRPRAGWLMALLFFVLAMWSGGCATTAPTYRERITRECHALSLEGRQARPACRGLVQVEARERAEEDEMYHPGRDIGRAARAVLSSLSAGSAGAGNALSTPPPYVPPPSPVVFCSTHCYGVGMGRSCQTVCQ